MRKNFPQPAGTFPHYTFRKRYMAKRLVVRGQTPLSIQKDGYTLTQSLNEYIFPSDAEGKILSAITLTSTVKVTCGDEEFTVFTIGPVARPSGFSSE